jgi:hypothetical protein
MPNQNVISLTMIKLAVIMALRATDAGKNGTAKTVAHSRQEMTISNTPSLELTFTRTEFLTSNASVVFVRL